MGLLQSIVDALRSSGSREVVVNNKPGFLFIPEHRKELLFFSTESPPRGGGITTQISITNDGGVKNHGVAEPSTIYRDLPISKEMPSLDAIPKMGYFPSYTQMTPVQRVAYLTWLSDVTNPIEVGYAFVYLYGLERHLVYGKFDEAVQEILLLRQYHDNGSFQSYSATAIVHACLLRRRIDVLQCLYLDLKFDYFGNSVLLMLHHQHLDLMPDMLTRLAKELRGVNRKYIRESPDLYEMGLLAELNSTHGKESYPFAESFPLNTVMGVPYPVFANYSFAPDVRTPLLPNLLDHKPFEEEFGNFFQRVHERVKVLKKRT